MRITQGENGWPFLKGGSPRQASRKAPCVMSSASAALVPQAQRCRHGGSVMGLTEVPERLLVSTSRAFDECILAGRHAFPPSVAIVHPGERKRLPRPLYQ